MITDGYAGSDSKHVIEGVLKQYRQHSITLATIFVQVEEVNQLFPHHISIKQASDLPGAIRNIWADLLYPEF